MKITWDILEKLSNEYGGSFYLLDSQKFVRNYKEFLKAFRDIYPNTFIAYSYKTNYVPKLCKLINDQGGYAEVVSEMEYDLAIRLGVAPQDVIFNGPYKKEEAIKNVLLGGGIVNLDSYYELELVERIASENPEKHLSIGIRCNFDLDINKPVISRFGFDIENDDLPYVFNRLKRNANVLIKGLHCHFPNRNIESYVVRAEKMLKLSKEYFPSPPDFINLGGGYFSKMSPALKKQFNCNVPSYKEYAKAIATEFKDFYQNLDQYMQPKLILEPGSALVADTMKFVAKIINIKVIRSKAIATALGSIHNINPTLNSKNLPLKVYKNAKNNCNEKKYETIDIAGYTCIESDYLYKGYSGYLSVGDYLVFDNAGSYSIVLKPPFILPNFAIIEYNEKENLCEIVKRREENKDIFRTYEF